MRTIMTLATSIILFSTAAFAQETFNGRNDRGYNSRSEDGGYQSNREPSYSRQERSNPRFRDLANQAIEKEAKTSVKPEEDADESVEPAKFFFRDGDRRIRIQCDTRETMKACVEAASLMFDKFKIDVPRASVPSSSDTKKSN